MSMTIRIAGTGSCLPKTIITNQDLANVMDTSDEWISSRTGIRERRIAVDETTTDLAAEAAKRALEDARLTAQDLDLIIVGTRLRRVKSRHGSAQQRLLHSILMPPVPGSCLPFIQRMRICRAVCTKTRL